MVLETERLVLRNWQESDAHWYMVLARDVGYNCFSCPGYFLVDSPEQADKKIEERLALFKDHKLGKFPIFLKGTGDFIGTCGIAPFELDGQTEVELGYRLCLKYWGQGYATESALAILKYGFKDLNLKKILAFALPQNRASIHVIEKLGFQYLRGFVYNELPHQLFQKQRDQNILPSSAI